MEQPRDTQRRNAGRGTHSLSIEKSLEKKRRTNQGTSRTKMEKSKDKRSVDRDNNTKVDIENNKDKQIDDKLSKDDGSSDADNIPRRSASRTPVFKEENP